MIQREGCAAAGHKENEEFIIEWEEKAYTDVEKNLKGGAH